MDCTLASPKFIADGRQAHPFLVKAEDLLCGDLGTGASTNPALGTGSFQTGLGSLRDPDGLLLREGCQQRNNHIPEHTQGRDVLLGEGTIVNRSARTESGTLLFLLSVMYAAIAA